MGVRAGEDSADGMTGARYRLWQPPVWTGMDAVSWIRLLAKGRFAISLSRLPMVCVSSGFCVGNSVLNGMEALWHHRRIAATEPDPEPLLVLGHWRTGTTLLQELLSLDPRHVSPTTYECFSANHFLLSERFVKWWMKRLMPRSRPMDNVAVGLDRPQEDEFALFCLGVPSPYLDWAFPNEPPRHQAYLDLRSLAPAEREKWKAALVWFLKSLARKHPGKRFVLKSPTHSYRVRTLLEVFPRARFVHIVRDPSVVIPSTIHTWKRMTDFHGAQRPKHDGLEEQVFERFERYFEVFTEDRGLIAPERFCEIRYEDLVADPVAGVREIYARLDLGEIAPALPALEEHAARSSGYQTNRFRVSPELQKEIRVRCASYIDQYDYQPPASAPQESLTLPAGSLHGRTG